MCVCVCVLLLYQVASHSKMRPIVTDVFRGLYLSVCLLVSTMSCAKTAELIEMSFATWTRVGPKNHVPDGGADPPWEGVYCGPMLSRGNIRRGSKLFGRWHQKRGLSLSVMQQLVYLLTY